MSIARWHASVPDVSRKVTVDEAKLLRRTDEIYHELCALRAPYTAPELLPAGIRSCQVKALIAALCEQLNEEEPR